MPEALAEVLRALARASLALGALPDARHDEVFSGNTVESMSPQDLMDAASVADAAASLLREEASGGGRAEGRTLRRVRIRGHAGHRV